MYVFVNSSLPIAALAAGLLLAFGGAATIAQTVNVEKTPIPRDRKPDFSTMNFLVGTWSCSVLSSRRPKPFHTTAATSLSADGYWLITKTVTESVPWNPITITNDERVTYDPTTSRWIDLNTDDYGAYDVSTSPGWNGSTIEWTEAVYPRLHGAATLHPRTMTKFSDTRTQMVQRFEEASGKVVTVTTDCLRRPSRTSG